MHRGTLSNYVVNVQLSVGNWSSSGIFNLFQVPTTLFSTEYALCSEKVIEKIDGIIKQYPDTMTRKMSKIRILYISYDGA